MQSKQQWLIDDSGYFISDPDGGDPIKVVDSYSQWTLKHGKDFDLSEELNKEEETDFSYVGIFSNLANSSSIGSGKFNFRFFDFNFFKVTEGRTSESQFVARLPLRRRSIPTGGLGQAAEYEPPEGADKEKLVVVGIMDDAINVGHERLRVGCGNSRVDYAWIQDADCLNARHSPVPFGREWSRGDIDNVLAEYADDDDQVMLALDLVGRPGDPYRPSPLLLRRSHGTHVADLAAGYDPVADAEKAINRRIIAVQLPALASQDTSGAALMVSVMEAARFIFDRAYNISCRLKYPIPVILNFSYAFNSGPRIGLHLVERRLRELAAKYKSDVEKIDGVEFAPPVELVLPTGNAHLTRTHAATRQNPPGNKAELSVKLRLQPQDRTSSYLEIWFPYGAEDMSVTVEDPEGGVETMLFGDGSDDTGKVLAVVRDEQTGEPCIKTITARIRLDTPNDVPNNVARDGVPTFRVLVCFAPTEVMDCDRVPAAHGLWKIRSTAMLNTGGKIHAWIQRDESFANLGIRGRQAYFEDDVYDEVRFDGFGDVCVTDALLEGGSIDSPIKRDGTISGIATNEITGDSDQKMVVTGGYRWASKAAAVYSAAGFKIKNAPEGGEAVDLNADTAPLVMCISDRSRVLQGVLAACTRNGSRCVQNGTSVSAPQVVRYLADHFECVTDLQCRAEFDSHNFFRQLAEHEELVCPQRPSADHHELASNNVIRKERVKFGLIPLIDDLHDSVARGILEKVD